MSGDYEFLALHAKFLRFAQLWPHTHDDALNNRMKWKRFGNYFFLWSLIPTMIPLTWDIVALMADQRSHITDVIEPMLAWVCIICEHYLAFCFLANRELITKIAQQMGRLQEFRPLEDIIASDRLGQLYTKILMIYASLGTLTYVIMPRLKSSVRECERAKSISMVENKIPCNLVARVRVPFSYLLDDRTAMIIYNIMYAHQVFLVIMITWVMIILTTLLYSVVIQLVHHFRQLRMMIKNINTETGHSRKQIMRCITYHKEIINMCDQVNEAFGSQMTMFLILPSFVMSILGFELLIVELTNFIRYVMHLFGWICILLLVCYSGQTLINESEAIAINTYDIYWYNLPIDLQKDVKMIIMRGQKPLHLNAFNLGYLSLATFLKVVSSAYSYFTLLLNMK